MDDGLLITTISSSFRMNSIGSFTTGGSCLENGNKFTWFGNNLLCFLAPTHKMVKHNQTIRRLLPANKLSVLDHFVGLAVIGLNSL